MTDLKLPLPGADEVLLCTEHTTLEHVSGCLFVGKNVITSYVKLAEASWCNFGHQVELLWRRATAADNGGKIYCLVDADKLDYDVAEKVERKLENLLHGGLLVQAY